jgi:polyisoprenoid-binding protein YceI
MRHTLLALAAIATLSAGAAQAESATYAIDPSHTFVTFEIGHMGTSTNRGRFDKKEGTVQLDVAGKSGKVDLTNPVTLKASNFNCYQNPMLKREVCGGDFDTTIQRSQWGMTWGANYGFPDAVHLIVQVEAVKQ